MRYAAETHPTPAETHPAATEMHPAAAKMHSAATAVETTTTAAEVCTTAAAAVPAAEAVSGLRGQWRHDGCHRRQQDCTNRNAAIFHVYLQGRHVNFDAAWVRADCATQAAQQSRPPTLRTAATIDAAALLGAGLLLTDVSKS
jgi:hypothetical protein